MIEAGLDNEAAVAAWQSMLRLASRSAQAPDSSLLLRW